MNKKTIIGVVAALAAVLVLFAACSKKDGGKDNNAVTVVGDDGQAYEQVTEIHSEIVSEVVTDKDGNEVTEIVSEIVTDKNGKTEVKTEAVKVTQTRVETTVVTVTKPYTTQATTGKNNTTAQATTAKGETTTSGSAVNDKYVDQTLPEGTKVEVATNANGTPTESKLEKVFKPSQGNKQMFLDCSIVSDEMSDMGRVNYKVYLKNGKMAIDMSYTLISMKVIVKDNTMTMIIGNKYYTIEGDDSDMGMLDTEMWDSLGADNMKFIGATLQTVGGTKYYCEEYTDGSNTNKYYFGNNDKLERIEIIGSDGSTTIMAVKNYSATVSDSAFTVPSGYTKLTESEIEKLLGGLA